MNHGYTIVDITNIATHFVGLFGVAYYYVFLIRQRVRNSLENKLAVLLALFCVSLFGRSLYWYSHKAKLLQFFLDSLGTLLPMVYAVFAESLMKRHLPKWMKVYFVSTTATFFITAWMGQLGAGGTLRPFFIVHLVLFMAFMSSFILSPRVREGLSVAEVAVANTNLATLWIGLPFYVVDFLPVSHIVHLKYDMLGALIFTYSTLRVHRTGDRLSAIFREVGSTFQIAIAATLLIALVAPQPDAFGYLRIFVMVLCLSILWIIIDRIRYLNLRSRDYPFLGWLANATTSNLNQFIEELRALKVSEDFMVVHEAELDGYHSRAMVEFLRSRNQSILRKDEALRLVRQSTPEDAFIVEQLLDLMKRHRMDSVSVLRSEPAALFLAQLSQAGQAHRVGLEVRILQKFSGLIQS